MRSDFMFDEKEFSKNVNKLNTKLYEIDLKCEEEKKIEKRKVIHKYIENFNNFDTENIFSTTLKNG
jgi:hypothetical protein